LSYQAHYELSPVNYLPGVKYNVLTETINKKLWKKHKALLSLNKVMEKLL